MPRLLGKFALITGGSSGIGLATARAFVTEGARVAITGRNPATLEAAKRTLPRDSLVIRSDASDLREIDDLFIRIEKCFGALDILFANAGVSKPSSLRITTEEDFDEIFATNVKGLFFTVQKAIPLLRSGASVILNASVAPQIGSATAAAYAGSKAAVRTFARNFSAELAQYGVRVNVVSPGAISSRIDSLPALKSKRSNGHKCPIPLGRFGTPEDVANVVVFLASNESIYMLGSEVVVDGGRSGLPGGVFAH